MSQRERMQEDFVPRLPDLIASMAVCWRAIRDAQTEVDPFGTNFGALEEARVGIESLAHQLTGQRGFLKLRDALPTAAPASPGLSRDGDLF